MSVFKDGRFNALFRVTVCIWAVDRLARAVRVVLFSPRRWSADCLASLDPSAGVVRLTVPLDAAAYAVRPGAYVYLMLLDGGRPWESHPFTVARVSPAPAAKPHPERQPLLGGAGAGAVPSMTFLIRPYSGQTRRLGDLAAAAWPAAAALRVAVDGPYGHSRPLDTYDRVLFVVGGTGVATALAYLELLARAPAPPATEVHWAVREPAFARHVVADMGPVLAAGRLTVTLYLSSSPPVEDAAAGLPAAVRRHSGRPDARALVVAAVAATGTRRLAVTACGPARLCDDTRSAVVEALGACACQIDYFEESFSW